MELKTDRGIPTPFGVTRTHKGHNFALYARSAASVSLKLVLGNGERPDHVIKLNHAYNRTGDVWHVLVENLPESFAYLYRIDRYPPSKTTRPVFSLKSDLLDPYVRSIAGLEKWRTRKPQATNVLKGRYLADNYDWENDRPPRIPLTETIIYELHVRGFTRHESSGVNHPGTFQGIIEKIDYLKHLGITAVELLPIQEFDEMDCRYVHPETGEQLVNYWGYSTIGYFALKDAFAADDDAVTEFRNMVKALHAANIEVILDIVFNHTAEGDRYCRILNFKGLANDTYYMLDEEGDYRNFSGCGNTLNCNHPIVRRMILDSLRFWVVDMHVDGFRFDLASILTRDEEGNVLSSPPVVEEIAKDPVLSGVKLIAEPWDAGGLYQVGGFPAFGKWAEWNGKFRDTVRRFVRGEAGLTGKLATRISGKRGFVCFVRS